MLFRVDDLGLSLFFCLGGVRGGVKHRGMEQQEMKDCDGLGLIDPKEGVVCLEILYVVPCIVRISVDSGGFLPALLARS